MGRKLKYKMGSFYRTDDRTGFPQRAERTKKEWNGLIIDEKVWEPRQPQDLVRGVKDIQSVPQARPLGPNSFVGPFVVQTTAACAIGATSIPVQSIQGMSVGDNVGLMLDTGVVFRTTIIAPLAGTTMKIAAKLPYTMASGNTVTDYQPNAPVGPGLPS